ncbi:maleylpyruvate isomerase family mycothiol-dependent enzyme [Nocardia sp. NBC_00565]|uniref:maleylpyruvate isomerase family mycothiol-dependent enzyme n=1 Tax=Nocardia sp. NBC_00565 TaxID=2975993 RepID=UPI002E81BACE|nr:maleylpyruvate isomerase family mycothiol-dependent enzyme [Nocardia sp. NBC_00565]WUC04448.1 maleylpyruvate isomerase family mycothiol-dependent enzyme [Nocardia sp. NBC_00565]
MTDDLLERAVAYLLSVLPNLGPDLSAPTPCRDWNMRMLLAHMDESIAALREGLAGGQVRLTPGAPLPSYAGPLHIRSRAVALLDDWANEHPRSVVVFGRPVPAPVLGTVGALELTIHAWDLAATDPTTPPIPDRLASELLTVAPELVPMQDRWPLFAPPIDPPTPTPSDQLLAYLGRTRLS